MTIRRPILQTSIVLSPRVRSVNSYYKVEGAADSVLISLPKGRYVLAFAGRHVMILRRLRESSGRMALNGPEILKMPMTG